MLSMTNMGYTDIGKEPKPQHTMLPANKLHEKGLWQVLMNSTQKGLTQVKATAKPQLSLRK